MSFMHQQITDKKSWVQVETTHGTVSLPAYDLGLSIRDSQTATHPLTDKQREQIVSQLSEYCEGTVQEWETILGYGARLSAPGYLDCTEWTVFDTANEAQEYLDEYYPNDETEEESI